ncbi:MAG: radical SAM protein, partial [Candidatus Eisenbacteria bacterium]
DHAGPNPREGAVTTVYWDMTSRCNAECIYCSAKLDRRATPGAAAPPGFGSLVLDRLRVAGARRVILLGGEPTLLAELPAIIAGALDRGMDVGLATNGQSHDDRLRALLLDREGLAVNFSLDSFFPEENDAVRGSGYHARALRNLRKLLAGRDACGARSVRITIQATLTRVNLERLEESLLRLADLGVDGILLDRMRSFAWQAPHVRDLAPDPAAWIRAAACLARTARRAAGGTPLLLNYGNARLRAALAERYDLPVAASRRCPGGLQAAVLDVRGELHPCRLVRSRPVPLRADGTPWFEILPVPITAPGAVDFLASPYFVGFFNFAHSARIYERLSLCRECPYYENCEPCPLDAATHGELVLAECRRLIEGGLP